MSDPNKLEFFDAVVIGGGPAGSAAAFTLASNGLRTCLIDKSSFPREKLCGGLITLRSKSVFETVFKRQWDEALFLSSSDIEFRSNGKLLGEPLPERPTMFFTMRLQFDAYLVDLVRQTSTVLMLDTRVASFELESNSLTLENGETIQFRYLVGADGVNSQVAKSLFGSSFNTKTIGFGLEVEVPREHLPNAADVVEIDFAAAHWGYGWIFPKKKTFTVGVGGIHRLNPDLRTRLAIYLSSKSLDISNYKVKGQFIPFGECRKRPGLRNVLLCGDAAGAVDPITGEGIAYAMQSGHAAAVSILSCIQASSAPAIDVYVENFRSISHSITLANRWRYLIFPRPIMNLFAWAFADASTLRKGYLDILAGKHDYDVLGQLFVVQIYKAIRKLSRAILGILKIEKKL